MDYNYEAVLLAIKTKLEVVVDFGGERFKYNDGQLNEYNINK